MVQAIIKIEDQTNRILNMVKAKYSLRDKSEAINVMAKQYAQQVLEPELKPEYIEKLTKKDTEKGVKFNSMKQLRSAIEDE